LTELRKTGPKKEKKLKLKKRGIYWLVQWKNPQTYAFSFWEQLDSSGDVTRLLLSSLPLELGPF
jgi:hypothetical protein